MDWSDDLTYSVHDVEDFYRAGLIPLHLLRPPADKTCPDSWERQEFLRYVWSRREKIPELDGLSQQSLDLMFAQLMAAHFRIDSPYDATREQRARLRTFTSSLVNRYINGSSLVPESNGVTLRFNQNLRTELAILKQLTWRYVIERPGLAVQQHAQKQTVKYLFSVFRNEISHSPTSLLPPYFQQRLKMMANQDGVTIAGSKRLVCDLIAGMTERQAIGLYQRLNGIVVASGLDNILV